jgi:hypothetical protein
VYRVSNLTVHDSPLSVVTEEIGPAGACPLRRLLAFEAYGLCLC